LAGEQRPPREVRQRIASSKQGSAGCRVAAGLLLTDSARWPGGIAVPIRYSLFAAHHFRGSRGMAVATRYLGGSPVRRLVAAFALAAGQNLLGDEAGILADRRLDLLRDLAVGLEERLGVLAPLADALAVVGEPGARLLDHAGLDAEVEDLAGLGDALALHDVELDLLERRGELVLDHLHPGLVADHLVALLDDADAADVEAYGGIEFQRVAAGGGLRRAVHHADLHADLVDE